MTLAYFSRRNFAKKGKKRCLIVYYGISIYSCSQLEQARAPHSDSNYGLEGEKTQGKNCRINKYILRDYPTS